MTSTSPSLGRYMLDFIAIVWPLYWPLYGDVLLMKAYKTSCRADNAFMSQPTGRNYAGLMRYKDAQRHFRPAARPAEAAASRTSTARDKIRQTYRRAAPNCIEGLQNGRTGSINASANGVAGKSEQNEAEGGSMLQKAESNKGSVHYRDIPR